MNIAVATQPGRRRLRHLGTPSSGVELAGILANAIRLNLSKAKQPNVRMNGFAVGGAALPEHKGALLGRLVEVLARTILNAQSGSLITCYAEIVREEMRLHLRFAAPSAEDKSSTFGGDWIDELWSWPLGKSELAPH